MGDVLVRNVSDKTLDRLKKRAAKNNRSLQAELSSILDEAGRDARGRDAIDAFLEFHRQRPGFGQDAGGPDSLEIIRRGRERDDDE